MRLGGEGCFMSSQRFLVWWTGSTYIRDMAGGGKHVVGSDELPILQAFQKRLISPSAVQT